MNNLAIFANLFSHLNEDYIAALGNSKKHKDDLDNITSLVQSIVEQEHPDIKKAVVTSWGEHNTYIDFRIALKPEWCKWSPENQNVVAQLSIDTEAPHSWYMYMFVDDNNGPCEDWGEVTCQAEELDNEQFPVTYMLNKVREKYDARKAEYDKHIAEGMVPDDA